MENGPPKIYRRLITRRRVTIEERVPGRGGEGVFFFFYDEIVSFKARSLNPASLLTRPARCRSIFRRGLSARRRREGRGGKRRVLIASSKGKEEKGLRTASLASVAGRETSSKSKHDRFYDLLSRLSFLPEPS